MSGDSGKIDPRFPLYIEEDDLLVESSTIQYNEEDDNSLYCTCQKKSYGLMIECENKNCTIKWFHFDCVNLKVKPKGYNFLY